MTRYEKGFIEKCAEYGVDGRVLLTKVADPAMYGVKRPMSRDWMGRPMKPASIRKTTKPAMGSVLSGTTGGLSSVLQAYKTNGQHNRAVTPALSPRDKADIERMINTLSRRKADGPDSSLAYIHERRGMGHAQPTEASDWAAYDYENSDMPSPMYQDEVPPPQTDGFTGKTR